MKRESGILKPAVVLFLLIVAAYVAIQGLQAPDFGRAGAGPGGFSLSRAMDDIRAISREPHPLGSAAHDEVLNVIVGKWKEMGIEPEVQTAVIDIGKGEAARVRNILARLKGTSPGKALMLAGHYDSVTMSYGAADDGSAVAIILETARVLKSGPALKHDMIFLITDAEEDGLIGARAFVKSHPWAADVGLALNFEARGTSGPGFMFQTSRGNSAIVREFLGAAPRPRANSFAATIYGMMPNDTDQTVFMAAGMQALNFAFIGTSEDYHTPQDRLENLDPRSLAHLGETALAAARHFDEKGIPAPNPSDLVYFNLIGSVVVRYKRDTAFLLSGLSLLLLVLAGIRGFAGGLLKLKRVLGACALLLGGMALAAILSVLFVKFLGFAHGNWFAPGNVGTSFPYFLAVLALVAAVFLALFRVRMGWPNFAFAAASIGVVLGFGLLMSLPGASYVVAVPAFFLTAGLLALTWTGKEGFETWGKVCLAALAAVPAVLLFIPLLSLFFTAMGLNVIGAAGLGLLVPLLLAMILPALEIVTRSGRKAWVWLAVLVFIGLTAAGAATTRFTARFPKSSQLGYRYDFDSWKASWFARAGASDAWISEIIKTPRPGFALADPAYQGIAFASGDAPVVDFAPPDVTKLEESTIGPGRALKIRVSSPRRAWKLAVFSTDAVAASASVDGIGVVKAESGTKGIRLRFTDPGPDGFTMVLENCRPGTISVTVEEWILGIPDLAKLGLPEPRATIRPVRLSTVLDKTFRF